MRLIHKVRRGGHWYKVKIDPSRPGQYAIFKNGGMLFAGDSDETKAEFNRLIDEQNLLTANKLLKNLGDRRLYGRAKYKFS